MSFFAKVHKLHVATVLPRILDFAHRWYELTLTNDGSKNDKHCHGPNQKRPDRKGLHGKQSNWLKLPDDSLYSLHLGYLTQDAPKMIELKSLIERLGDDVYGRIVNIISRHPLGSISFCTQ